MAAPVGPSGKTIRASFERSVLGGLFVLFALLSACGGSAAPVTASSQTACSLMSASQASHLLGLAATPSPRPKQPGECLYVTHKGPRLIVDRFTTSDAVASQTDYLSTHSHLPGASIGSTDGTRTLWLPLFDGGRLDAMKGDNAVTIWVGFGAPNAEAVADEALMLVLPKI